VFTQRGCVDFGSIGLPVVSTAGRRFDGFGCDWAKVHVHQRFVIQIGKAGRAGFGHSIWQAKTRGADVRVEGMGVAILADWLATTLADTSAHFTLAFCLCRRVYSYVVGWFLSMGCSPQMLARAGQSDIRVHTDSNFFTGRGRNVSYRFRIVTTSVSQ
jgi:hypothetical protein